MEENLLENLLIDDGKKKLLTWRILTVVLLIIVVTLTVLYSLGVGWKEEKTDNNEQKDNPKESILTLWKENSE